MKALSTYLSEISEFRRQNKNFAHPLHAILMLSVVAIFHFARQSPEQTFDIQDYSGSHNEVTTYKVSVCQDLKWLENAPLWPNLSTLVKVETHGERRGANVRY